MSRELCWRDKKPRDHMGKRISHIRMWTESNTTGCGKARYHHDTERWIVVPGFYDVRNRGDNRTVRVPFLLSRLPVFRGRQIACTHPSCRCAHGDLEE